MPPRMTHLCRGHVTRLVTGAGAGLDIAAEVEQEAHDLGLALHRRRGERFSWFRPAVNLGLALHRGTGEGGRFSWFRPALDLNPALHHIGGEVHLV
jgi:hypothetical protein